MPKVKVTARDRRTLLEWNALHPNEQLTIRDFQCTGLDSSSDEESIDKHEHVEATAAQKAARLKYKREWMRAKRAKERGEDITLPVTRHVRLIYYCPKCKDIHDTRKAVDWCYAHQSDAEVMQGLSCL